MSGAPALPPAALPPPTAALNKEDPSAALAFAASSSSAAASSSAMSTTEDSFLDELNELLGDPTSKEDPGNKTVPEMPLADSEPNALAALGGNFLPEGVLDSMLPKDLIGSLVLEAVSGFMFLLDAEGVCQMCSESAEEILGPGSRARLEGTSIYSLIHQVIFFLKKCNVICGI